MKTLISICLVCLPLKHLTINSGYGYRVHPLTGKYAMHYGIDLKARHDTVYAILDGFVKSIGYDDGLGIHIRLNHGDFESVYGHLKQNFGESAGYRFRGRPDSDNRGNGEGHRRTPPFLYLLQAQIHQSN